MGVEVSDGKYIVTDVTLKKLNKNRWKTVWDSKLKLLEMYLNDVNVTDTLSNAFLPDYHSCLRTRNRHLKAIKAALNIDGNTKITIIYSLKKGDNRIKITNARVKGKLIDLGHVVINKKHVDYVVATDEKVGLVKEYEKKLDELIKLRNRIFEGAQEL